MKLSDFTKMHRLILCEVKILLENCIILVFKRQGNDYRTLTVNLKPDLSLVGSYMNKNASLEEMRSLLKITDWQIPDSVLQGGKWYTFAKECEYDMVTLKESYVIFTEGYTLENSPVKLQLTLKEGTIDDISKVNPDTGKEVMLTKKEMELLSAL